MKDYWYPICIVALMALACGAESVKVETLPTTVTALAGMQPGQTVVVRDTATTTSTVTQSALLGYQLAQIDAAIERLQARRAELLKALNALTSGTAVVK